MNLWSGSGNHSPAIKHFQIVFFFFLHCIMILYLVFNSIVSEPKVINTFWLFCSICTPKKKIHLEYSQGVPFWPLLARRWNRLPETVVNQLPGHPMLTPWLGSTNALQGRPEWMRVVETEALGRQSDSIYTHSYLPFPFQAYTFVGCKYNLPLSHTGSWGKQKRNPSLSQKEGRALQGSVPASDPQLCQHSPVNTLCLLRAGHWCLTPGSLAH